MKKYIILLSLIFLYGCETPLNDIVAFSGYWRVICQNNAGTQLPEFNIVIKDDGTFSNKVKIYPNVDSVFVKGAVDNNGTLVGQFCDSLATHTTGNFSGTLTEINGIRYGSGTWIDTIRGANSRGTWTGKSN